MTEVASERASPDLPSMTTTTPTTSESSFIKESLFTKEQKDFLKMCEEKFEKRFTETDEEYMKLYNREASIPPIMPNWGRDGNYRRDNRQRNYYDRRHSNYQNPNRGYERRSNHPYNNSNKRSYESNRDEDYKRRRD